MKPTVFKMTIDKMFLKSNLTWMFLFMHVSVNLMMLFLTSLPGVAAFIFINAFAAFISAPGLILHINYYRHSRHRVVVLTAETISMTYKDKVLVELINTEIKRIVLYGGMKTAAIRRFPWDEYHYFVLTDGQKKMIVPYYIMEISQLWQDGYSDTISRDTIIQKSSVYID